MWSLTSHDAVSAALRGRRRMIFNQCIGKIVNRRTARIAGFFLTLAASLVLATPSFAQAQAEKADNVTTKKKQRPVSTPELLGPSAASSTAAGPAPSQTSQNSQAVQAQNPLTPLWGVINENYTNFRMGPLKETQNILVVEPIIPLKLTPDWNLVTRWNTPMLVVHFLSPASRVPLSFLTRYRPQSFETEPGSIGCEKSGHERWA